ncbi:Peptidase M16 inactive domain protein [Aquimixticola soesokkakensis]|uniref:Peptidase M16 inactive domain protein n=1 Tax=Aquimixticola soesokkakensis TaxID=1519096 RepID=A0A1Y5TNL6_9RHOB|nr:pitrilysin family protein [Aquimixticola soesokkakensis]SLN68219.1 Peptidase M16 inactive domain protein [Aquimixticola soesokkakensis]
MIRVLMLVVASALSCVAFAPTARAAVDIQTLKTPGGINVWLVEEHSIPFTALEIRFKGGAVLDRPGKRGEVNLMMALIEEGAGDMDAQGFAKAREALAASYKFDAYDDGVAISAKFLTENRTQAVDLLRTALMETRFDEDAVERVKGQVQSIIASEATDPGDIAIQTFDRLAFAGHPYATSLDGTPVSVEGLTRDDMFTTRDRILTRDRLYVSAVGDISAAEVSALVDRLFAGLPEVGAPLPDHATYQLAGGTTIVPFDTPQSIAVFGHEGIRRNDPDYVVAYIVNEIFGGGREARLMSEVREKRGLTYGIGTYLLPSDYSELILGQFASANDKMGEALAVVRQEWAEMAQTGITQEELDAAKTYLTGAYALRFDGNAPIAKIMVGMQMIGLGPEYVQDRNAMVEAVTLEQANAMAKRLYDPEALHVVVVGDPLGVEGEEVTATPDPAPGLQPLDQNDLTNPPTQTLPESATE